MGKKFYGAKTMDGREFTFTSWQNCKEFTKGKSNILFKGFDTYNDLQEWFNNKKIGHTQIDSRSIQIYVDGSYNNRTGKAGWGWVAVKEDKVIDFQYGECKDAAISRQIDGELQAAIEAMSYFADEDIIIVYDYAGIALFATGDWTPRTKISVDYVNYIKNFVDLDRIIFSKIAGHSGNEWNDMADTLAKKGCGIKTKEML